MADYIPTPVDWVREHVELYESTNGKEGVALTETGLPCIIVTHTGNKTGGTRKTPLMRVADGGSYVLIGSMGGAPNNPVWVYNLRANADVQIRDRDKVMTMKVREVADEAERSRLWDIGVEAYPPYADYQNKTSRKIPVFIAEPA
jgi:deazaflavin-dependent oxidoreductase (nitroreductase family)